MDRRGFLKTGGAVAAGAAAGGVAPSAFPSPAMAARADATRLLLTTSEPDAPGFAPRRLAQRIETVSAGRFSIEMSRDSAGQGAADLAFDSAHKHARHHAAFAFFAGLPCSQGLGAEGLAAWLAVGGGQMLWDALGAEFGFKPLLAGHTGPSAGLWSNRRLDAPADLAGARMYATGLAGDVMRAFGADVMEFAPHELTAALADGRIDAAEWLGPRAAVAPDFRPLAERLYAPGLTQGGMALALAVRSDLWERMNDADRAILEVCATAEYHASLADARAHAMIESRFAVPPQRLALTPGLGAALDSAAGDAVERLAGVDAVSRRIADSYRAFRDPMGTGLPAAV